MNELKAPFTYFADIDGGPLDNGKIWVGEANRDARENPANVFWDVAGALPAEQPIRTISGMPARLGTPARLYIQGDVSLRVEDQNGALVYAVGTITSKSPGHIKLSDYEGDDETTLQRAVDDAAKLTGEGDSDLGYFVEVDLEGRKFVCSSSVNMLGTKYRGIIVRNGKISANPDVLWPVDEGGRASTALITVGNGAARTKFESLYLDGQFKTNCFWKKGFGNWTTVDDCYVIQFEYWGVRYSSGGAFFLTNSRIIEHLSSIPTTGSRKGRGIWIQSGDAKIFENISNWSEYPLYIDHAEESDEDQKVGSSCLITSNHFYNGVPGLGGVAVTNPVNIYVGERSNGCYFSDNYYDSGQIILRPRRVVFNGGRFTKPGERTVVTHYFVLQPNAHQSDFKHLRISGPFDWTFSMTPRFLTVDETEATYTGNIAALEYASKWPMIGIDTVNEVRLKPDVDDEDFSGPYTVHSFASTASQSRIVFRDLDTTATAPNTFPFIGSMGDSLVFGATGMVPVWAMTKAPQLLGGGTTSPEARIHLYGNGIGSAILQESAPDGNASPVVTQIMSGLGNSSGVVAKDRDHLVSGDFVTSHYMHWRKPNASTAVPRTYSVTWGISATGAAHAVDTLTLSSSALHPVADNTMSAGKAGNRFSQVYAGTSTINTSDEREKTLIGAISDEIIDAVSQVEIIRHKFVDAVAKKGDAARWHFGVTAQGLAAALTAAEIDPETIGAFCYDEFPAEYDEGGELVRSAGDRYGVRYQELMAIQAEGFRRKLAALEARIAALETP